MIPKNLITKTFICLFFCFSFFSSFSQSSVCFTSALDYIYDTGQESIAVANADFNKDGKLDLIVANARFSDLSVLLGDGLGAFSVNATNIHAEGSQPNSIATGDFNSDGNVDFAVSTNNKISVFIGDGSGKFSAANTFDAGQYPRAVLTADFNGDSKLDLAAVENTTGGTVVLLFGDGKGSFSSPLHFPMSGVTPYSLTSSDFNNDGKADLAATTFEGIMIWMQKTDGFTDSIVFANNSNSFELASGDLNADKNNDLITVNGLGISVRLGNGSGSFSDAVNYQISDTGYTHARIGDFNNDLKIDIAITVQTSGQVHVLPGIGNGEFGEAISSAAGARPFGLTAADFNKDGKPDLAVSDGGPRGGVAILIGKGTGSFIQNTSYLKASGNNSARMFKPITALSSDLNKDGISDLIFTNGNEANNVSVFIGSASGKFANPVGYDLSGDAQMAATDDFNNDGKPDLAVLENGITILFGDGTGAFPTKVHHLFYGTQFICEDFNNDNQLDIALISFIENKVTILYGKDGGNAFETPVDIIVGAYPQSLEKGDFNADGKTDIAIGYQGENKVSIFLNGESGQFTQPIDVKVSGGIGNFLTVANFNNDEFDDIAASTNDGTIAIYVSDGKGAFSPGKTLYAGYYNGSIIHGDFNLDGKMDLAMANMQDNNLFVFLGKDSGEFSNVINFPISTAPYRVTSGDLNNDGMLDVMVAGMYDNTIQLMYNNTARIIASGPTQFCQGSVDLVANSEGYNYLWSQENNYTRTLHVTKSGSYNVTISNATGSCKSISNSIIVDAGPSLPETFILQPTCTEATGSIDISKQGSGELYSFDNGKTFQSETKKSKLPSGEYKIVIKNQGGCSSPALTSIVSPQPQPPAKPVLSADYTDPYFPVLRATSSSSYKWFKDGVRIIGATDISYKASESGSYSVIVTSSEGCESQPSDPLGVIVTGDIANNGNQIRFYPNPATEYVYLDDVNESARGTIVNSLGKEMNAPVTIVNSRMEFDVRSFARGVYFIRLTDKNQIVVAKVIKQ